jgi:hypothetical protein
MRIWRICRWIRCLIFSSRQADAEHVHLENRLSPAVKSEPAPFTGAKPTQDSAGVRHTHNILNGNIFVSPYGDKCRFYENNRALWVKNKKRFQFCNLVTLKKVVTSIQFINKGEDIILA